MIAGCGPLKGTLYPRIVAISVQEKLGAAVIAAGAQEIVAGADLVAPGKLIGCFSGEAIGELIMAVIPTVIVARFDAFGDGDDFSEKRAAVVCGAKQTRDLKPELRIIFEEESFGADFLGLA